eukprot:g56736.t1
MKSLVQFRHQLRFDASLLPKDMLRVFAKLKQRHGEEYALLVVFLMQTAIELHRAWHMTLLTSELLLQLKNHFKLRVTWSLGVLRLKFRIEDGDYELHRRVPYDYDSEFQDLYTKVAVALIEDRIDIHAALKFQIECKQGKHTAPCGLFLREHPGRLVLYPIEAATCAVVFFNGNWRDAGVAALCGLVTGLIEANIKRFGQIGSVVLDLFVGLATGVIAGVFQRFLGPNFCLSSI